MNNIIKTQELRKTLRFNLSECERLSGAISPLFFSSCACTPFWCARCSTAANARCFQQDKQDNLTRMHNKIRLIPHKTDLPLKANLHIEPASEERFARWCWSQPGWSWSFILFHILFHRHVFTQCRKHRLPNMFATICVFLFNTSQGCSKKAQRRTDHSRCFVFFLKKKKSALY